MNKNLTWQVSNNMFGHTYHLVVGDTPVLVRENMEHDWLRNQKSIRKAYWFRAPKISIQDLGATIQFLSELENTYFLEVFGDDPSKLNASLKLLDETDAATLAWTLTAQWMKWSKADEKSLQKDKPAKVTVGKDGKVRVKVTVSAIEP